MEEASQFSSGVAQATWGTENKENDRAAEAPENENVEGTSRSCCTVLQANRDQVGTKGSKRVFQPKEAPRGQATPSELVQLSAEQGYCCATCGIHIEPDESELDHKVARSDGGSDLKENLQWLCIPCNRAKGTLSMSQFVELCMRVVVIHGTSPP